MKTGQRLFGFVVPAVLVVLVGALAVFLVRVPEVTDQMPAGVSSLIVTLSAPSNDAQVPLNQFTNVSAEALGVKPIAALELWIDGTPSGTQNAPAGSTLDQFTAFWTWTPASEGEHTLLVRAIDADHNIGMSNIVRVTASNDANVQASVAVQAKAGDTVSSLAQEIKVDPQQIIDLNPQVDPSSTIAPGEAITVPIPMLPTETPTPEASLSAPPEPPGNPNQPPANGNPNKYQVWWNQNILEQFSVIKPAAAPGLSASPGTGQCFLNLYIYDKSDNEDGFFLYRLDPNAFAFDRIATLDAHSGSQPIHYVDPVPTGKYQYYVSSFNAMGESASSIVASAIIEPCVAPQQQSLGLNNALVTVTQPVDKIYCYLRVDNGLWTRIPPGPATFIAPTKPGEFDVSQYLKSLTPSPPPPQITLHLDCWGWKGDTLIYLGDATKTISQGVILVNASSFQLLGNLAAQTHVFNAPVPEIAPPINAKLTSDPNECIKHFPNNPVSQSYAATQCPKFLEFGYKILTWDWLPDGCSSGTCIQDIQGYQVYLYYFGQPIPTLLSHVPNRDMTVAAFPPPQPSGPEPPHLIVTAYKAMPWTRSADSNNVTVETTPIKKFLAPLVSTWFYYGNWEGCNGPPPPIYLENRPLGIVAGYEHREGNCDFLNYVYQGAVWFDVRGFLPEDIVQVLLKYTWEDSFFQAADDIASNAKKSCAAKLKLGRSDWRSGEQPQWGQKYADPYLSLPWGEDVNSSFPPEYSWDVTSLVKEWIQGSRPNYGFILEGPNGWVDQDWGTDACASVYDDFSLELTVQ